MPQVLIKNAAGTGQAFGSVYPATDAQAQAWIGNGWAVLYDTVVQVVKPAHEALAEAPLLPTVSGAGIQGKKAPQPAIGGAALKLSDISVVSGSPTVTLTTGPNGQPAIKIVTGVGVNAEISFPGLVNKMFYGDAFVCAHGDRSSGFDFFTWYVSAGDATYTNFVSTFVQYGLTAPSSSSFEQQGANTYHFRKAALSTTGTVTFPALIGANKLRITPLGGQAATIYLYAAGVQAPPAKGRICVVWDDGYDSMFGLGYDAFASRGIPQTLAIIGSVQGSGNGYSNINQLRAFVNAGNALVAHGPWPSDATSQNSNVVDLYAGTSDPIGNAIADAKLARQWISDNGLTVPGYDRCYVWPQGKCQSANGDTRYFDAWLNAGFTCARNVGNVVGTAQPASFNFDATSKYGHLTLPIIGHLWSGTTANEVTNISNITTAIQALATNRTDAFLMLHRVVPNSTSDGTMGANGNILIRNSDLETIAAQIATSVAAGALEAVTMPSLALTNGWWQQF